MLLSEKGTGDFLHSLIFATIKTIFCALTVWKYMLRNFLCVAPFMFGNRPGSSMVIHLI